MHELISKTAEKLLNDGEKVATTFEGLTPEQAENLIYSTYLDTWRVKDVLAHLTFAEIGFMEIFQDIVHGGDSEKAKINVDEYNYEKMAQYKNVPLGTIVQKYRETRAATLEFVDSLSDEDLQRTGLHPALGITTLLEMIKMIYLHTQMHMRDVKKTLIG